MLRKGFCGWYQPSPLKLSPALVTVPFESMARPSIDNCKRCGGHASEVGRLSRDKYCFPCGRIVYEENIRQLQAHSGPFAQHHRRQLIAAFGGVLPEDVG